MTPSGTNHACDHCGQPITVTTRNPNRRFCSPRCRVAHWHAHHRPHHTVPNAVHTDAVANPIAPTPNAVPGANGVQHCPHCHAELAVITVVVPAQAAHIRTPEVTPMSPT
jgi:endogenous inhibitor of DNA gyrase (YacG/DUF329 family)